MNNQTGDTLVEVVLSIAILSVTLVAAYNVANNSYRIGVQARERVEATNIVQEQAEMLRAWRDQNIIKNTPTGADPIVPHSGPPFRVVKTGDVFSTVNCTGPTACPVGPGGRYRLWVTSSPTGPNPTPTPGGVNGRNYTIRVEWTRIGGGSGPGAIDNTEIGLTLVDRRIDRAPIDCDEVEKCS